MFLNRFTCSESDRLGVYSQTCSKEVEGGRLLCLTGRPPIGVNQRKITFIIQSGEFILLEYTPYIPVELFFSGKVPRLTNSNCNC